MKDFEEFGKEPRKKDGLKSWCKKCNAEDSRERLKNPGVKRRAKEYKRERLRDPEVRRRNNEYKSEYRKDPKVRKRERDYRRERRKENPQFKIAVRLRRRLNHVLKDSAKAASTFDLIGCNASELVEFLQGQFLPGMRWENIHIDHVRPCASFDLTNPEEQRQCFHYTNLQPMFATANLSKNAKILTPDEIAELNRQHIPYGATPITCAKGILVAAVASSVSSASISVRLVGPDQ